MVYHAWDEDKDAALADIETGLSYEVCGEGAGWYSNILIETLEVLPTDHPDRLALEEQYYCLAEGLKRYQDET